LLAAVLDKGPFQRGAGFRVDPLVQVNAARTSAPACGVSGVMLYSIGSILGFGSHACRVNASHQENRVP
jgi:hypothetical protein